MGSVNAQNLNVYGDGTLKIKIFQNTFLHLAGLELLEVLKMGRKFLQSHSALSNRDIKMNLDSATVESKTTI